MTQELGRISRPSADQFRGRRKLLLVPLVYGPQTDDPDGAAALQTIGSKPKLRLPPWKPLWAHCNTSTTKPHCRRRRRPGTTGATDQRSHRFIHDKCQAGAVLEATENLDVLLETWTCNAV